MDVEHLSNVYDLVQGQGAQVVDRQRASAAGRTSTSPRRCARRPRRSSAATAAPATGPTGACGRRRSRAAALEPLLRARRARAARAAARPGSRCRSPAACGRRRSTRPATPATACRVAIDPEALRQREVVPHRLHLRRQELADHQLPRRRRAASACRSAPLHEVAVGAPVVGAPVPLRRDRQRAGPRATEQPAGQHRDRVQGARARDRRDGQRADPHALAQRPAVAVEPGRQAPRRQRRPRRGDRVRPEARSATCSACPGYGAVPQGQADHDDDLRLLGRAGATTATTARASRSRRSSSRR